MESHVQTDLLFGKSLFKRFFYDRKTHEMMCQGQKSVVKKGGVSITHWTEVQKMSPRV